MEICLLAVALFVLALWIIGKILDSETTHHLPTKTTKKISKPSKPRSKLYRIRTQRPTYRVSSRKDDYHSDDWAEDELDADIHDWAEEHDGDNDDF